MKLKKIATRTVALAVAGLMLTGCGQWRGIANVPLPGGPGTQNGSTTIYIQMPETLALNANSRVRVADVFVGRVRKIELKNWTPLLTVDLEPGVELPKNALARIGQTSLLGSQHVELDEPDDPSPEKLRNGDTIPLERSSAFPTIERTLASISGILTGGGIPNIEVIQNEVNAILTGRSGEIRELLNRLDTFTYEMNQQREDLTRAIDSTNRLLGIVSKRTETLDRVLTEFPPLIKHFADTRDLFADAVTSLGRLSATADETLSNTNANLNTNLKNLQRPLRELAKASPYLVGALKLLLTVPFNIENIPKAIRGDYINVSLTIDLTLSAIDNGFLSGTGISGMLRALEQAWGRDPATMMPDVRFTPNPNSAPNGPLIERSE
ncbi:MULTISPECIES: virulence factor Mce family protein [Actinomycetes]|uniref:Mammalian cell entry protein n=1 Tax=Mycolicibacterium neoaurum VKM Ac-1815D TaxID=700508 RepID=V5X6P7_MYCNE|nr:MULTISPECIES: virulence factor Mce family protein [Actinomycetes]AHC23366.1 mammalian cell entry protein [Mycolicibacterium neoaurum VKM Ac-1815D]AMO04090.1 mammalian cell entry protein [Mycolicibacterium neoaurum]AXK77641.1 virulence factor Mce family protein [Mycolicibacterium neoaurum]KJQ49879.1 mammalian cell entry protein [Mycolicibacterium neoaurum]KUM07668.1 mammalian cell entry protein [Mycolicibacterium neoaurum]